MHPRYHHILGSSEDFANSKFYLNPSILNLKGRYRVDGWVGDNAAVRAALEGCCCWKYKHSINGVKLGQ